MARLLLSMLAGAAGVLAIAATGCAADPVSEEAAADAPSALGADAYRIYADLATEGGAAPAPGTVTVLGLRGLTADGIAHATRYQRSFDDTLIVLRADGTVARFAASTHPFELEGVPGVPDADGDHVADVGMIRPGVYDVTGRDRTIAGAASYAVTQHGSGKLPGWRDTNHDGILSDDERTASERRGDGITEVLFHQGEGDAPPAVGCQVLPASAIRAFATAVGGPRARFRYVLVDMTGRDGSTLPR
ncbi:MAG: hypothetical protein QOI41_1795 [Myxococcales bacterium]|nr:hypothetical protein [Myxococcales bacterium]